jgi:hypothetical protein
MPIYFLHVFLSIPIFLMVRRFYGWTFLSCSASGLLVVIVVEVLTFSRTVQEPFPPSTRLTLSSKH